MQPIHSLPWLSQLGRPGASSLAMLLAIATISRALLMTVIPLQALRLLGDAQGVSLLYLAVSSVAILGSMTMPLLLRRLPRKAVFAIGVIAQISCTPMLASGGLAGFAAGMVLQVVGIAAAEITINLYVLDHIPRRELIRFEPMRLFYAGIGWTAGPWLGVYMQQTVHWAPYALSAFTTLVMAAYYLRLGLGSLRAVEPRVQITTNPLRFIPAYFRQPRLALAWLLAVGRAGWWVVLFIYGPIYIVQSGGSESMGAAIVSLANGTSFIVPLWGRLARAYGVRQLLLWGYALTGLLTVFVALAPAVPWIIAVLLLAATVGASAIDGAGNVPFLRAVRPLQRAQMLSVYLTYRDGSQLLPPAFFSLLLAFTSLPAVFAVSAASMFVFTHYVRYLPRRL